MIARLSERLERLERRQHDEAPSVAMPPRELAAAWTKAIAVVLGGYPRSATVDSLDDGFARALGYADRDELSARADADPAEWQAHLERASDSLCARYGDSRFGSGSVEPAEAFRQMCAALDDLAGAKAATVDWAEAAADGGIARAIAFHSEEDRT